MKPTSSGQPIDESTCPPSASRLLVLREPGFNVLGELLLSCGEFLPVDSSDRLWLFHPTVWAEAVDIDRSDIVRFPSSGRVMTIPKLVFAEEKLPDVPAFVLVPTRQLYFRSSFVDAVIRDRLTGRRFVQVWPSLDVDGDVDSAPPCS